MLSWLAPDGFPVSARLPIRVDAGARAIQFAAEPAGLPLLEGRACLTVHRHAPDFTWQSNFQVRGNLAKQGDGWQLAAAAAGRRLRGPRQHGWSLPRAS